MRNISVISVTVALAALLAGCGSSSPPATAQGSQTGGPGKQAFAYAHCMQQHGVPSFPDPVVHTSGGQTSIKQVAPASVVNAPAFKGAQKACASLQPGPGPGGGGDQGPGKNALLAFARCLRSQGLTTFPDPNAQGQLTGQMITAAGIDLHSPGVLTAAEKCVGVTHGAITMAMVERAINHP
jgi:hypothetical protein